MKTLLITTAFLTAPLVSSLSAQTSEALKRQIAEQNRQIVSLEAEISSLQSRLNLERKRNGKSALPVKTATLSTSESQKSYTVKSGDTFSGISRRNGVSLASLIEANKGVKPNKIAIGQKLVIPQTQATATASKLAPVETVNTPTTKKTASSGQYTVQPGDTFYGIARKNNTTVAKLITMNPSVKPSKIRPGQTLSLNSSVAVKTESTPKSTVISTARATPKKESKPAPTPASKPVKLAEPTNIAKTVTVTSVMTYGQFAAKNSTTVSALNAMNGLDLPADEPMAVGSALYVPSK